MKHPLWLLMLMVLSALPCPQIHALEATPNKATVTFVAQPTDKKIFFQPESDRQLGYTEVKPGQTLAFELDKAAYYYYMDTQSKFYTVFLTPGSATRIIENNGQVDFEGDNASINRYMQSHPWVVTVPTDKAPYSQAWQEYYRNAIRQRIQELQASGLPENFIRLHSLYYKYSYQQQVLAGPEAMRMFMGQSPELPANYYDEIKSESYNDPNLLYYPKWFTLMRNAMDLLEKQGEIEVNHLNFLRIYADRIGNNEVKAAFLLRYLEQILNAGYSEDFPAYLAIVKEVAASTDHCTHQLAALLKPENQPPLTKEESSTIMREFAQAPNAEKKDEIMTAFMNRVKREKADFAYPLVNMMLSLTIQALYEEGKTERGDKYIEMLPNSAFKRDALFISGSKCYENRDMQTAEKLIGQAARMTLKQNEGKPLPEDEKEKYPPIFGTYAQALIANNRIAEAVPYAKLAYEHSNKRNFGINQSYVTTLAYEQLFVEAMPILEDFVKTGMSNEQHRDWLQKAYIAQNGKEKGFDDYMNKLQEVYTQGLKDKLTEKMVEEPAPLFELKNLNDETVSLASLKGKIVVLDFWATWCGPCKASFPAMQEAAHSFAKDKDVVFLFINTLDNKKNLKAEVSNYLAENKYNFNVLFDGIDPTTKQSPVMESYKAEGIPAKFIIDRSGKIRFKLVGFSGSKEETVEELKAMIHLLQNE